MNDSEAVTLWFWCLAAAALAVGNTIYIFRLRQRVSELQSRLLALVRSHQRMATPTPDTAPVAFVEPIPGQPNSIRAVEYPVRDSAAEQTRQELPPREYSPEEIGAAAKPEISQAETLERQFGARLPAWIGGVALALAGFFLVRYTIEAGLLTEQNRVILGGIFGSALLAAGHWVRQRPSIANGARIAQALSGAGIADLYATLFVATSLYHLMPSAAGFTGMAAVTAAAVILSLRHGVPIAVLGLIGGFLTPALVASDEPNIPLLFGYLYCVFAGLVVIIRQKNWWPLAIPAVIAGFAWVVIWMLGAAHPGESLWPSLFLIAVSATVVLASNARNTDAPAPNSWLNYVTLGGSILLSGVVADAGGFSLLEWSLFGLLAAGAIALAVFKPHIYGFVPWVALGASGAMFASWSLVGVDAETYTIVISAFGLLFGVSGYLLMWHAPRPQHWAGLSAASALGYYLLAYTHVHDAFPAQTTFPVWGAIALALAFLAVEIVREILQRMEPGEPVKQRLLALFSLTATAFLSLGLTIELQREFLSVAIAGEILALSWIATKVRIDALRPIAIALTCVFGALLFPQILLLIQLSAYSVVEAKLYLQDSVPIVDWPWFQLGLPALMFACASVWFRRSKDDVFVRALEGTVIALTGIMAYYVNRHAFHSGTDILFIPASFVERGITTNILFAFGLLCLWTGRRFDRIAVTHGGMALAGVALFRIVYFDLLVADPAWSHQFVGTLPLVNNLLLPFGLPLAAIWMAMRELNGRGQAKFAPYLNGLAILFLFALVSLNVRQLFHGAYLDDGVTSNAEVYAYSAAWLVTGAGLLLVGTLRKDQLIRAASLAVMVVTIGKVFLYDASELEGLYRVFSFLGLGLALLGLSWFYSRFVFVASERAGAHS